MSLARTIIRGARLKLRLGVNGSQKDSRSFGAVAAAGLVWAISFSHGTRRMVPILELGGLRSYRLPLPEATATTAAIPDRMPDRMADRMADKAEKSNKLKPRLPRGFTDRSAAEIAATRQMIETIRRVYELYGFEPVETPAIEYTEALGK